MRAALIKLHIAVFLWGFTGVLGRLISLNEGLLVWYRLVITIATLLVLIKWRKEPVQIPFKTVLYLFGIGSIVAIHWVFFYGSIKYSNVSIALTCLSSAGLFTAFLEPLFYRRQLNWVEVGLGCLAILGIYLIFHFDTRYQTGIILGLIASFLSVVFSLLNKKMVNKVTPKVMMLYELTGGWILLSLLLPFYITQFPTNNIFPSFLDWIWLCLLSWFCTVLAMGLSLQALKKISAFTQNLTLNLEPVYGIVLAFVIYKENEYLNTSFYVGFILIILAVLLQTGLLLHKRRKVVLP